jgi:large subunit ribosomal protein L22
MKTDIHSAKVIGRNLTISTKQAIVISKFIRGKNLNWAKKQLEGVVNMKVAVPFTVHNKKIAHRKGRMAAGRYPINASKEILMLLNSLDANAQNKGLDSESLYISSIIPNQASRPMHSGRKSRTMMKRTHLEIIAEEKVKEKKQTKKPEVKEKVETKKEVETKPETKTPTKKIVKKVAKKVVKKKEENKK